MNGHNRADVKIGAHVSIVLKANKDLKRTYLTNEVLLIGKLKDNLILILMCDDLHKRGLLLEKLIHRISFFKVALVHDRHFPRPTEAHKKSRSRRKRVL